MSELSSCHATVERLVNHLDGRKNGLIKRLDLSDEDIADAIWLALQMGVVETKTQEEQLEEIDSPEEKEEQVPINDIEETTAESTPQTDSSAPLFTEDSIEQQPEDDDSTKAFPFQVPAAPAIQNKLPIGRALRPLMRKVSSTTRRILDVEATVNQIAKRDIWLPVTKPEPERWLDLELLVEESRSSFLWKETIDELQQLLENQGAFRSVRVWSFSSNNSNLHKPNLQLSRRRKASKQSYYKHTYRELIRSNKRGLILIVSDCISDVWQQKDIYECLHKLSNKLPTAIMQLFPERLWQSSELGLGYKLEFSAFTPGVPNSKLLLPSLWEELETQHILKLPVVTLEAFSLGEWSKVLAGFGNTHTPGFVFDLDFVQEQLTKSEVEKLEPEKSEVEKSEVEKSEVQQSTTDKSQEVLSEEEAKKKEAQKKEAEEVVDRFLATASPIAQRLAGLMAAAPVDLSVVNLIRQECLGGKATPVNVAEVFLSGMIRRTNASNRDREPQYDFILEARKLLNQATRLPETENVLDKLSEYIARKLDSSIKTFRALLLEYQKLNEEQKEQVLPFAKVTKEVLENLGGEYTELARRVDEKWLSPELPPKTEDEEISEPQIKSCTFKVATVEVLETRAFEFYVATLEQKSRFLGFGNRWVINRRKQQGTSIVEVIEPGVELELMEIPGGSFTMGAPETEEGSHRSERPQHQVTVPSFCMGKYPITQGQWKAVAGLPKVERDLKVDPSRFKGDRRPVERVSWYDAVEFCARLSKHTGREYRLPSEAQWEYACRAGTTTPFHFGETITSELANYEAQSTYGGGPKGKYREETTPVGSFDVANAFGLYDMHGNVLEWCLDDWHSNYEGAPVDGSGWMNENDNLSQVEGYAVLRGGSWVDSPILCRSAYRDDNNWSAGRVVISNFIGFRVVCAFGRGSS